VKVAAALLLVSLVVTARARAQAPAPPAVPAPAADTLQSPEVHADGTVTLRLRAPKAAEVTVAGEWSRANAPPNAPEKLVRDTTGIWSITVGPLPPNIYIYVFNVDGMTIVDPINPRVKLRARSSASMVEVPGGQPWEARDVPHGALAVHTHTAVALNRATRQFLVYTPPDYDKNRSARYPVVYLLHGNNDLAVGWTMAGKANLILDNLIADKKAVPMIVVMPWGHALPFGASPAAGQPSNNDLFERYLLEDVRPLVEAKYRTAPGRRNRAVVGLSMGGAQALQLGLLHRDLFASIWIFGSGMTRADFDARYNRAVAALATDPNKIGFLYVGVGKEDGVRPRAKELAELLGGLGMPAIYRETDGGHTYPVWRKLLVDTAPLLFRKPAPGGPS
jgi:enterochelin esterase-like enzyme